MCHGFCKLFVCRTTEYLQFCALVHPIAIFWRPVWMDLRNTKSKSAIDRVTRSSKKHQAEETAREAKGRSREEFEIEQLYRSRRSNKKDDVPNPDEVRFMYEQPEEQEEREKPEDAIPDLPENQEVCFQQNNNRLKTHRQGNS